MTLTPQMPNGMTTAERLQRANQAKAVTSEAAMSGGSPAVQAPAPVAEPVSAPVAPKNDARPWEKVKVSEKSASKRLPLIMSVDLRAKLEYLADKEPGESMSSIAIAGIEAECLRQEQAAGLLPEKEQKKVRSRVEDKHPSSLKGEDARLVLLVPGALQSRMDLLIKDFQVAKNRTELALPGIADECNRRLKSRGEL